MILFIFNNFYYILIYLNKQTSYINLPRQHLRNDNVSGTLMIKALEPLNLKKDSGLLTGLLTHKIAPNIESDARDLVTLFYWYTHSLCAGCKKI
jgi:hypothetical protein